MKKIYFIFSIFLTALFAISCSQDNLDIPQKGVIDTGNFYKTEADALSSIGALYGDLTRMMNRGLVGGQTFNYSPYLQLYNMLGDDIWAGGGERGDNDFGAQLNEFRFTSDHETVRSVYRSYYACVYAANLVIENYAELAKTNANVKRYIAEARAWRAWCYMNLAIGWGTPPLVTEVISASDYKANTPFDEVMNFVITEFGEAAKDIPSKPSIDDKDASIRLTKESVYAFMGKAQVHAGKFADAAANLKTNVIDKKLYGLVAGEKMVDLFHRDGNYSREKVFEFNIVDNTAMTTGNIGNNMLWQHNDYWAWRTRDFRGGAPIAVHRDGWGGPQPTGEFARALIANDGLNSPRRKAWFLTYEEVLYELKWRSDFVDGIENGTDKNLTLAQKRVDPDRGCTMPATKAEFPYGCAPIYGCEGYFNLKRMALKKDELPNRTSYYMKNFVIMRYSEVLLLFAEAAVKSGTLLSDGLAALNEVQNRAHEGNGYVSKTLTFEDVKKERYFELWMEGCRFLDIVRWGEASTIQKNQGKEIPHFHDLFKNNDHGTLDDNTWVVTWVDYNKGNNGFKANQHELLPFPYWATSRNPELIQNPNWGN